jgi:hypothetical protein
VRRHLKSRFQVLGVNTKKLNEVIVTDTYFKSRFQVLRVNTKKLNEVIVIDTYFVSVK